jgi:molybdopterin-guanine dinucleotide biosynthesis protein A
MSEISVAVFAGGKSLRFGSSKINAKINGREFGEIIFNTLKSSQFEKVFLVGGDRSDALRWGVDYLNDEFPDSGPLGALVTAMRITQSKNLLILPCDVPFIDVKTLETLKSVSANFDVRVADTDSPQWLCSTWRLELKDFLENEFAKGQRAIHQICAMLKTEFVKVSDSSLRNINSISDLD